MAKVFIQEDTLQGIADAIRGKNGSSDTYTPLQMATAIQDLSGGGSLPVNYRLPWDPLNTNLVTSTLTINVTIVHGTYILFYVNGDCDTVYQTFTTSGTYNLTVLAGSWMIGWVTTGSGNKGSIGNFNNIFYFRISLSDYPNYLSAYGDLSHWISFPNIPDMGIWSGAPALMILNQNSSGSFSPAPSYSFSITVDDRGCFLKGTKITLADGTYKNCEDITFDDELLVWDFYNGCFASAKPMFIKKPETTNKYVKLTFDDGTCVCYTGHRGYHRIFNEQAGMFTSTKLPETPIGTITFKDDSSRPKLISKEIVNENCEYYNIITDRHYNCFTNGILSSCKISNTHSIIDMKYTDMVSLDETFVKEYLEKIKNNPIWIKK